MCNKLRIDIVVLFYAHNSITAVKLPSDLSRPGGEKDDGEKSLLPLRMRVLLRKACDPSYDAYNSVPFDFSNSVLRCRGVSEKLPVILLNHADGPRQEKLLFATRTHVHTYVTAQSFFFRGALQKCVIKYTLFPRHVSQFPESPRTRLVMSQVESQTLERSDAEAFYFIISRLRNAESIGEKKRDEFITRRRYRRVEILSDSIARGETALGHVRRKNRSGVIAGLM